MEIVNRLQCLRWLLLACMALPVVAAAVDCRAPGIQLQVLGSGGPELDDARASSGYLVWQDGRARVLVDMGPGSLLNFERSGARVADIELILLSHLHVDHSADLPALVKGAFFSERHADLPIYGPTGNRLMPATAGFLRALFADSEGAYRYLGSYLNGSDDYRLLPIDVPAQHGAGVAAFEQADLKFSAVPVHHGPIPALAWRVELGGRVLVFSGDMNGDWGRLPALAQGADLLLAHHAVPEEAAGVARNLHMPPSVIGRIAKAAGVKRLILSHRMQRTLGREAESESIIRRHYRGSLAFADDAQCFALD